MITYRYGIAEYQADCLETAVRSSLARQSCDYDGQLEQLQRQVSALEEIVVALLAKLPTREALELVDCTFVSED